LTDYSSSAYGFASKLTTPDSTSKFSKRSGAKKSQFAEWKMNCLSSTFNIRLPYTQHTFNSLVILQPVGIEGLPKDARTLLHTHRKIECSYVAGGEQWLKSAGTQQYAVPALLEN
jgi:hypothetical protein